MHDPFEPSEPTAFAVKLVIGRRAMYVKSMSPAAWFAVVTTKAVLVIVNETPAVNAEM